MPYLMRLVRKYRLTALKITSITQLLDENPFHIVYRVGHVIKPRDITCPEILLRKNLVRGLVCVISHRSIQYLLSVAE